MWITDLRAVMFSSPGILRFTRPDALRFAAESALIEHAPARLLSPFPEAWSRYEANRARRRWADHGELPIESLGQDLFGSEMDRALVDHVGERLGECLEWHPDALPTLDYLRESGYRTVLLSDLPIPLPRVWQERSKPWFDETVSSRDLARRTPDPSAFREALRRLRLGPHQVLHVGEGVVEDVHAAQAADLRTALLERFGRGRPDPEALAWLRRERGLEPSSVKPDLRLRTLEELAATVDAFA